MRELIDKVSGFKKFVVQCENSAADLSKDATTKCDACNAALGNYLEKLAETISSRDISEKKLAASAGLKIECKSFLGMIVQRTSTLFVLISKSSLNLLFRKVCGVIT